MNEELDFALEHAEEQMVAAINHLEKEFSKLRTGKANPQMLDSVYIDYYGTSTHISKVANINLMDAKTIIVQPWEKNILSDIEKSILYANLGFTPQNNGEVLIISVPPLTEERRRDIAKNAKSAAEIARVSVRNVRRDANEVIKKLQKDGLSEDESKIGEEKVQKLTDSFIKKIDEKTTKKETEIMTV